MPDAGGWPLELESIEFVTLAEKITERYGDPVDLIDWLATKELDDLIALTVGEIVDFLASSGAGA
jgi:acyl carrier protein